MKIYGDKKTKERNFGQYGDRTHDLGVPLTHPWDVLLAPRSTN